MKLRRGLDRDLTRCAERFKSMHTLEVSHCCLELSLAHVCLTQDCYTRFVLHYKINDLPHLFLWLGVCRSCPSGCDGGQAGPQRVDYRAVVAAGAEATDGSEPPEDAGHDASMGTRATRSFLGKVLLCLWRKMCRSATYPFR